MMNYIKLLITAVIIPVAAASVLVKAKKVVCDFRTCIDSKEEERTIAGFELSGRILKAARYISYGALKRNNVPCKRRGRSYYSCGPGKKANPYKRGCSVVTHCYRFTS
ncbi:unnamed protein product [Arabidopsis lyrata]|uniref:Uncharacterized protein n=1 Tax=Arabidopsis lyrata subsp. lyrata TaxID=81972 RepID=D7MDK5_ARALL|nr:hypothetical protein ARALYDRAFT_913686 [Arabidopsis lyrata subsp. lyrata]CAH8275063.1 unnamed protein product [Arabidopsis lyrata]